MNVSLAFMGGFAFKTIHGMTRLDFSIFHLPISHY